MNRGGPIAQGAADRPLAENSAATCRRSNMGGSAPLRRTRRVNGPVSYHLCIYDESAGVPAAVVAVTLPPGGTCDGSPCWSAKKTGFLYKDKSLTDAGLGQLQLKADAAGKAKIVLKGKGEQLPLPTPVGASLFAQDTALIVQLVNSEGKCWEADFSQPAKKNDSKQFNDKSD